MQMLSLNIRNYGRLKQKSSFRLLTDIEKV